MLREKAEKYYLEGNYNCAEAVLRAANEVYALALDEDALRLAGGFGGGMGAGETCGALSGAVMALSALLIKDRAHTTPDFREACAAYVARFGAEFGSLACREIKPRCAREGYRCLEAVLRAASLLEDFVAELPQKIQPDRA